MMKSDRSLARSVSFPRVINIYDFRRLAKRRLPAVVFAYIDGGAEDEVTLREGEVLHIKPGVAHQVEALDDTFVLGVFSPVRRDWV